MHLSCLPQSCRVSMQCIRQAFAYLCRKSVCAMLRFLSQLNESASVFRKKYSGRKFASFERVAQVVVSQRLVLTGGLTGFFSRCDKAFIRP